MENKKITKGYLINQYCNTVAYANGLADGSKQTSKINFINEMLAQFFGVCCKVLRKEEHDPYRTVQVLDVYTNEVLEEITLSGYDWYFKAYYLEN